MEMLFEEHTEIHKPKRFTVGGTISGDDSIYVERQTDLELYTHCIEGELGYILTGRQMGKSSLMVKTAKRLKEEGHHPVIINLEEMGANSTADEWYFGIVDNFIKQLPFERDGSSWWERHNDLGLSKRFFNFVSDFVMQELEGRVVIFVDEIDNTLNLSFADDFFAVVRALHNSRFQQPELERLSIVLIGTATPNDLIKDSKRTTFNVGQRIELDNFSIEEAMALTSGFNSTPLVGRRILKWIWSWTKGHPYLTQKVCSHIAGNRLERVTKDEVDRLVYDLFISYKAEDSCIAWMKKYLLDRPEIEKVPMLETYRRVLLPFGHVVADPQSFTHQRLILSGLVKSRDGYLQRQNRIFQRAFNQGWISRELPWIRLLKQVPKTLRQVGLSFALILIVFIVGLGIFSFRLSQNVRQQQVALDSLELKHEEANSELLVKENALLSLERAKEALEIHFEEKQNEYEIDLAIRKKDLVLKKDELLQKERDLNYVNGQLGRAEAELNEIEQAIKSLELEPIFELYQKVK